MNIDGGLQIIAADARAGHRNRLKPLLDSFNNAFHED